jgi:hypothetical protein
MVLLIYLNGMINANQISFPFIYFLCIVWIPLNITHMVMHGKDTFKGTDSKDHGQALTVVW